MPKFIFRDRKQHKVQKNYGSNADPKADAPDPNVSVISVADAARRGAERQRLKDEALVRKTAVSGKKQKRLAKFIETKLRKEEGLELLKKLAQAKIDTSDFTPSTRIGQREGATRRREWTADEQDSSSKASSPEILETATEPYDALPVEGKSSAHTSNLNFKLANVQSARVLAADNSQPGQRNGYTEGLTTTCGLGLKRALEFDETGRPILKRRKIRSGSGSRSARPCSVSSRSSESLSGGSASNSISSSEVSEQSWAGFDSEDEVTVGNHQAHTPDLLLQNEHLDPAPAGAQFDDVTENGESTEGDEGSDVEAGSDDSTTERIGRKARLSGFKMWATERRNEALAWIPSAVIDMTEPVSQQAQVSEHAASRPAFRSSVRTIAPPQLKTAAGTNSKQNVVNVVRDAAVQASRMELPILVEEQRVMEVIHDNPCTIICGATGSGKTTQVPQFLFEAGYGKKGGSTSGMIGVTQPRRVAAVSMSKRVASELGQHAAQVAHQIRFDSNVGSKTAIKFMTDGILLREVSQDIALLRYSAIIVDEAHERSINTDILLGVMSRVCKLREELHREKPDEISSLKLIIMSATLRLKDLILNARLFPEPPPMVDVEGRQHTVTVHFARKTEREYVDQAFRKIVRGHGKLPAGGMLVFLTGQDDIKSLQRRLQDHQDGKDRSAHALGRFVEKGLADCSATGKNNEKDQEQGLIDSDSNASDGDSFADQDEDDGEFALPADEDEQAPQSKLPQHLHVLPLYSLLPTSQQLEVFEPPPPDSRLVVLATNIAETSLTIPNIRYVFDCGRAKQRKYNRDTGVQSFEVGWISQASAQQRMGRAGRTGPGHCYRLYSSAVYERDFPEFAEPEIREMPIEGVVLQLKGMQIQNVLSFPFPTPPDQEDLRKAEALLGYLGALDDHGQITKTGRTMLNLPVSPRLARVLTIGHQGGCLPFVVAIVAALSVDNILLSETQAEVCRAQATDQGDASPIENEESRSRRQAFANSRLALVAQDRQSDALQLLSALCAAAHEPELSTFCKANFLNFKAITEAGALRQQITQTMRRIDPTRCIDEVYRAQIPPPSAKQKLMIRQMLVSGFLDQVAIRGDLAPQSPMAGRRKPRGASDVPYVPLFAVDEGSTSDDLATGCVYLHSSSPLAYCTVTSLPQYIVYSYLQRSAPRAIEDSTTTADGRSPRGPRIRMRPLTPISGKELVALAVGTSLISYGKPLPNSVNAHLAGEQTSGSPMRECAVIAMLGAGNGRAGWPMGAVRVRQKRESNGNWVVEKLLS